MKIINLDPADDDKIQQVAALLVIGFREHWPGSWPDLNSGFQEVRKSFGNGRVSRVAVDDNGKVVGWIGAIPLYQGHVWELHPLIVLPSRQGQGIGRALIADLDNLAKQAGVDTIFLGSDDQDDMTSLSSADLYPDISGAIAGIRDLKGHPYRFYQKMGYVIVGLIPDANGPGKPDILMAKRVKG